MPANLPLILLFALLYLSAHVNAHADTLNWSTRPATNLLTATDTAVINGVSVVSSGAASGGTFDATNISIEPAGSSNGTTGYVISQMDARRDNETRVQTTTLNFSEPVYEVTFTVWDIDGGPNYSEFGSTFNDIVVFNSSAGRPTSAVVGAFVDYTASTGRAFASADVNVTDDRGNITVKFTGPVTWVTIQHIAGAVPGTNNPTNQWVFIEDVSWKRRPTLTLQKVTTGAAGGPFAFSQTNLESAPSDITTASADIAAPDSPSSILVTSIGTAITLTETVAAGFILTEASCTDTNSAITGNTGTIGTLSGSTLTIPAANVVAGAEFACTFTNAKLPAVTLTKISNGLTGDFDFAGNNGFGSQTITTATSGVAVTAPTKTLSALATLTTLTETLSPGFIMASAGCSGLGSGGTATIDSAAGTISLDAAATAAGAAITCTVVNDVAAPALGVSKLASATSITAAGQVVDFTITVTNTGNVPLATITVTDPLGAVTCDISGTSSIATLAPAAAETCRVSYTVLQSDLDGNGGGDGLLQNTATASADYNGSPVTGEETVAVPIAITTELTILKEAVLTETHGNTADGMAERDDEITYTYTVTNSGNVTLTNITVADIHNGYGTDPVPGGEAFLLDAGETGGSADAGVDGSWDTLGPGDQITFTSTYQVDQGDVDYLQ